MVSWTLVAAIAAIATVRVAPEYSFYSSYLLTTITFVLVAWVAKLVYAGILYPAYLTPLKQIPTPSVVSSTPLPTCVKTNTLTETIVVIW